MSPPRTFDYDEARRLRADGMTWRALGLHFGVSSQAVMRACRDDVRERVDAAANRRAMSGTCVVCGKTGVTRAGHGKGRCVDCAAKAATKVRDGEAYCPACTQWKPLDAFTQSAQHKHRGVHGECRACDTKRRRAYRETHREQARAYDRERRRRKREAG